MPESKMANSSVKSYAALSSVPYFSGLDDVVLSAIAAITGRCHVEPGEIVFWEGEPCSGLYIVQSGWLKGFLTSPEGREQIVRLLGPGETFNEHGALLEDGCNLVTVQAIEQSDLWMIDRASLLALMDQYPALSRKVAQNLAGRVVHLMKMVENLSLRTVEARVALLLLEQSSIEFGRRRWVTQAEMAARTGTVPDVVNRTLHKLEKDGLIRIARHKIEILDREGLIQKTSHRG